MRTLFAYHRGFSRRMMDRPTLEIGIEPRDIWVGVYWRVDDYGALSVFVCPIPMLVIRVNVYGFRHV